MSAGTYDIAVISDNRLCGLMKDVVVAPRAQTKGVDIPLDPSATLRVRYAGAGEQASLAIQLEGVLFPTGGLVKKGSTVDQVAPAGAVTVRSFVLGRGILPDQSIELRSGEVRELVIEDPR